MTTYLWCTNFEQTTEAGSANPDLQDSLATARVLLPDR